jgi:putative ABC transport system permease protein
MMHLQRVNPGFDPSHVIAMEIQLPEGGRYVQRVPGGDMEKTLPAVTDFYQRILEKARTLPAVESASIISDLPARRIGGFYSFAILGQPAPSPENRPRAGYDETSPGLFQTLKIPLIKGRLPDEHDTAASNWVVVVNQAFVQKFFPNQDPIGQQLLLRYDPYPVDEIRPRQIVGVVGDVKHFGLGQETPPFMYSSFLQQPAIFPGGAARTHLHQELLLRTPANHSTIGTNLASIVKKAMAEIDPNQPVNSITTLDNAVAESMGDWRFYMRLLGIFAGLAVLLAAIGIYGVMSYSVSERTHEIGIRVALGAHPQDVLRLVAKLGLTLTTIGILIGGALAFGLARLISTFLFGVKPSDPITYISVAASLAAIALLACYIPARRATKVDPLVALRYE